MSELEKIDKQISKLISLHKKRKIDEYEYQLKLNELLKQREKLVHE